MKQLVTFNTKGKLKKTWKFLKFLSSRSFYNKLEHYAKKGVVALAEATPKDSGETSDSWDYVIDIGKDRTSITWTNSNVTNDGTPVAILLQYGHGTRNGGFVEGFDFINPALEPIFQEMVDVLWREVTNA